jgi:hypothetical protein
MAADIILRSFGDASAKEDVLGLIENLTATENTFLNELGKTTAIATVHSTLTDTLRTAQSRAVAEGTDATLLVNSTPSRVTNLVESVAIPFGVTGIQDAIDHYHGQTESVRQTRKALTDWGNAAEFDIVRGTLTSGASGTAAVMKGIISWISTNSTTQTSGTTFNATQLQNILADVYDKGNGEQITDVFVGSLMKRRISSFTAGATKFLMVSDKTVVDAVDVYESDFGRLRVHLHRYVQQSSDATGRVLGVNMDKWKLAYLRRPFIQDLAVSGDYVKKQVIGDLTVEARNEAVNFFMAGFLKAA